MNADRRAWSFEQWEEYIRNVPEEELEREITTTHAIDLNHDIVEIIGDPNYPYNCSVITVFGILWFERRRPIYSSVVLLHPELIDWDKIHVKATGLFDGKLSWVSSTAAGLVCESGNPRIFQYCDPCAVAKIVDGTCTFTGAECFVMSMCQYGTGHHMREFFRQWDALPMLLLQQMASRANEHGDFRLKHEISAHTHWRERVEHQRYVVLWLSGDAKGSKDVVDGLWQGQGLGEVIAQRMLYSYKEYTEEEQDKRKHKKIKMDI